MLWITGTLWVSVYYGPLSLVTRLFGIPLFDPPFQLE